MFMVKMLSQKCTTKTLVLNINGEGLPTQIWCRKKTLLLLYKFSIKIHFNTSYKDIAHKKFDEVIKYIEFL